MIKLFKHQQVILSYLRINTEFAVFAEAGCGKTLPMLIHILELKKAGKIETALWVGPKSALGAVTRDITKFEPDDIDILFDTITVVNYDLVWRRPEYDKTWDLIVLDESHNIKNRTSRRASFLLKIACRAQYRYIMTGTPIANGALEDIWAQYTFLKPDLYRGKPYGLIWEEEWDRVEPDKKHMGSYYNFLDRYAVLNQYHKPYKYYNVNELQDIINRHSYRITKAECIDLPDKLPDEIIDVDCSERKLYKKLATESALLDYDIIADNPLSRMTKLRQLCSGYIATEDGIKECKCEKIQILDELIDRYSDDTKLVIFANFKYSIQQIKGLLDKKQISYVVLDGDQKDKNIWKRFQTDDSVRIIICQYQSGNAGIDLYAANVEIFYEPTTQSVVLEQARDRIHRQGQTAPCSYVQLLTKGTIEQAIYRSLARYEDFGKRMFEDYINQFQKSFSK